MGRFPQLIKNQSAKGKDTWSVRMLEYQGESAPCNMPRSRHSLPLDSGKDLHYISQGQIQHFPKRGGTKRRPQPNTQRYYFKPAWVGGRVSKMFICTSATSCPCHSVWMRFFVCNRAILQTRIHSSGMRTAAC